MEEDAYSEAMRMLLAGAMPFCLPFDDGLHVLSVIPTSQAVVNAMVNDDEYVRMVFLTETAVKIRENVSTS